MTLDLFSWVSNFTFLCLGFPICKWTMILHFIFKVYHNIQMKTDKYHMERKLRKEWRQILIGMKALHFSKHQPCLIYEYWCMSPTPFTQSSDNWSLFSELPMGWNNSRSSLCECFGPSSKGPLNTGVFKAAANTRPDSCHPRYTTSMPA